jgi:hypothetical protein
MNRAQPPCSTSGIFDGRTNHQSRTKTMNQKEANITTRNAEAENILSATQEGTNKFIKFKKGTYLIEDTPVPVGTEYLAHAKAWTKVWAKFTDGKVTRKFYRVARAERPPEREELGDLDEAAWPLGYDGKPSDPFFLEYWLPLESLDTGDIAIFVTSSVGGRQAISNLCREYAKRTLKGQDGQPIVQLAVTDMPTKNFGKVKRPEFEIVHWDDTAGDSAAAETSLTTTAAVETAPKKVAASKRNDMDEEIPF